MGTSLRLASLAFALACARQDAERQTHEARDTTAIRTSALPLIDSGLPRLEPRDEANASFREFREKALAALAGRDTTFLHAIVAAEIRTSFGGGGGLADFRKMWKTSDPSSTIWAVLTRVLEMGGQLSSDSVFMAPYVYAFWPDSIDAFSHVAVTTADALVHARPDTASQASGTASHSILRALEWSTVPGDAVPSDTSWVRVEGSDRRSGWIRTADVYSPVSWRAQFMRRSNRWVMILLVAGD